MLNLLEQQKPLLRKYTDDDIGDMTSGNLWISHAWSGDWYQMIADKPNIKYVIPTDGAVRGNDTMVVLSGAPHPIAAQLWINFNLDAQISAGNTNYIGYMGPNAAAEQYIDDAIKGDPRLNPPPGRDRQAGRADLPAARRPGQVHAALERAPGLGGIAVDSGRGRRGARRRRDLDRRPAAPVRADRRARLRRARRRLAGDLLPRAARDHPRRQPRVARRRQPHHARAPEPGQLPPGDPARVPAGLRELAPLRAGSRRSCRSSSATRSRTGSRATAARGRSSC